jgi:hypothetical protein
MPSGTILQFKPIYLLIHQPRRLGLWVPVFLAFFRFFLCSIVIRLYTSKCLPSIRYHAAIQTNQSNDLETLSLGACLFGFFSFHFVRERSRHETCTIVIRLYTSKCIFPSGTTLQYQYNDLTSLELLDFGGVSHGEPVFFPFRLYPCSQNGMAFSL